MTGRGLMAGAALALASVVAVRAAAPAPGRAAPLADAAPARLEDTGLYEPGRPGVVAAHNRPFSPQYPLWSDGAAKSRWVFLPPGSSIDATDPHAWQFPVGTRFWKEFRFGGRRIETRFLWKVSPDQWIAASYEWNAEGTAAVLAPPEGRPDVVAVAANRSHGIPSAQDCRACHGDARLRPLGFTALQLSPDRDPNAIHGEPLAPDMLTLRTLTEEGRLTPHRRELAGDPPRIRTGRPQTRAVLGYLLANCGSCHDGSDAITGRALALDPRRLTTDADAVAGDMAGRPTAWRVPGVADGASVLVDPHTPDLSALVRRMRSRSPSSQMPPLGTVLRDQDALDAVADWIATLKAQGSGLPAQGQAQGSGPRLRSDR
jgi:hypothetical protein